MTLKEKIIFGAVVVVVAIIAFIAIKSSIPVQFGFTSSGQFAEDSMPFIRQNQGYNSQLPINTSALLSTSGTFSMGTNGTALSHLIVGTCTINAYATTIAASSSAQVDCSSGTSAPTAITGITQGDKIFVSLASTTVAISEGLHVTWVAASTTNGIITMKIANDTGGTFTWASTASSSIPYLDVK